MGYLANTDWMQMQSLDVTDVDQANYDRISEQYGTNIKMRMKEFFEGQEKKQASLFYGRRSYRL